MRRGIIPNHSQWSRVLLPQLPQESGGGCRVAVALQFQPFHLAGFQAHRRIIAGLFAPARAGRAHQGWLSFEHPFAPQVSIRPEVDLVDEENLGSHLLRLVHQGGILRHEGLPLGCVGFEQTLLGPFQHKSQPVQVIQATAAAQGDLKTFLHKSAHHLPVPIGQVEANLCWKLLHHCLQFGLLHSVDPGGEPPDCSKAIAAGPPSPKTATHRPMVWASRASASATAVQPWTKSHRACHRSRSRGVGAQYILRRRSLASSCHCSRNPGISLIPNTNTTLLSFQAIPSAPQFYLIPM